jgi:putative transposase
MDVQRFSIRIREASLLSSEVFTQAVISNGIRLSIDGKGRAIDNVFIQRFWRTIKYEKIYLNPPQDGLDLYAQIAEYMDYYNNRRRHSSLDSQILSEAYSLVEQVA